MTSACPSSDTPSLRSPQSACLDASQSSGGRVGPGLSAGEYASWLQRGGLDETAAYFVAALDASIARGDLETSSQDLARLLGHPATPLAEVVSAGHKAVDSADPPARKKIHREPAALKGLHGCIDAMIEADPAIATATIWQRLAGDQGVTVAYRPSAPTSSAAADHRSHRESFAI
jgi:hypothetical protein